MDIMEMSAQELVLLADLVTLAEEAHASEKLINEHFSEAFGITKREIHVYHTESCGEYYGNGYLTIDGIFKYHDNWWGGRSYEFSCNAEGIYKMLRSCYLRDRNLAQLDPEKFDCEIQNINGYFRDFVKNLSESK